MSSTNTTINNQFQLGIWHYYKGQLQDALHCFEQVLLQKPHQAEAWQLIGVIAYQNGQYSTAIEQMNRAVDLNPFVHKKLSFVDRKHKKFKDSIEFYQKIIQLQDAEVSTKTKISIEELIVAGIGYQRGGRFAAAAACYQFILQHEPQNADAWNLLGVMAAQQQQFSLGIERIQLAIALNGKDAAFHSNLGNIYLEKNELQPALECYQQALELQSNNIAAQKNLAIACDKLIDVGVQHHKAGRLVAAVTCYKQVLQYQPQSASSWHLLGVIAAQQQQYPLALERIQRAIEINPKEAAFHGNLGNAYLEQKQYPEAIEAFQRALQINPTHADARKKLRQAMQALAKITQA